MFYCLALKNEEEIRRRKGNNLEILAKIFAPDAPSAIPCPRPSWLTLHSGRPQWEYGPMISGPVIAGSFPTMYRCRNYIPWKRRDK